MSVENLNDVKDMRPRLRSRIIPMNQDVLTTFDMGWLIPHRAESLVPGDKVNIGHSAFFRFDPFINPILSRANCKNYDFMIPERILYDEREYDKWFTGGVNDVDHDKLKPHLSFNVFYKFCYNILGSTYGNLNGGLFGFNTLCDYLGLPVNQLYVPAVYDPSTGELVTAAHWLDPADVTNTTPILLERFLAYALVYREYFLWNHDETSVWVTNKYLDDFTKIPFGNLDDLLDSEDSAYDADFEEFLTEILTLKRKGWNHDYFTSALPNIQSGDPATLGASGELFKSNINGSAGLNGQKFLDLHIQPDGSGLEESVGKRIFKSLWWLESYRNGPDNDPSLAPSSRSGRMVVVPGSTQPSDGDIYNNELNYQPLDAANLYFPHAHPFTLTKDTLNAAVNQSSGFTINDLRLLNAIQVYKERLNIGGTRLKEALYMQFGVTVPDDRLDRPDFVGYMDFPVQISEVLQTSQSTSDSVLGDQGGHGIGANSQQTVFNYFVLEPMVHISIMSVLPDTYYMQGLDPFWSKISRYDIWNPVFNHLSDQALYKKELYFNPSSNTDSEFGYLPRFAEYKATYNRVTGNLRKIDSGYMSWHQGRLFGTTPQLNQNFIDSHPTERVFAVMNNDEEPSSASIPFQQDTHVIGVIANQMKLARNVPSGSDPSLNID